ARREHRLLDERGALAGKDVCCARGHATGSPDDHGVAGRCQRTAEAVAWLAVARREENGPGPCAAITAEERHAARRAAARGRSAHDGQIAGCRHCSAETLAWLAARAHELGLLGPRE